jgi:hypothetical protein
MGLRCDARSGVGSKFAGERHETSLRGQREGFGTVQSGLVKVFYADSMSGDEWR